MTHSQETDDEDKTESPGEGDSESPNPAAGDGGDGEEAASEPKDPSEMSFWERMRSWPSRVGDGLEVRWLNLGQDVDKFRRGPMERTRLLTKIVLLHIRYIFGYLAAGFLVSAPLYFGMYTKEGESWYGKAFKSVVLGSLLLLPYLALIPLTRIEWERMRVPEFKLFELALARMAGFVAFVYYLVSLLLSAFSTTFPTVTWWFDYKLAWIIVVLMATAWVKVKAQVLLFPDFYNLNPGEDDLVLHVPRDKREEVEAAVAGVIAPAISGAKVSPGAKPETVKIGPETVKIEPETVTIEPEKAASEVAVKVTREPEGTEEFPADEDSEELAMPPEESGVEEKVTGDS